MWSGVGVFPSKMVFVKWSGDIEASFRRQNDPRPYKRSLLGGQERTSSAWIIHKAGWEWEESSEQVRFGDAVLFDGKTPGHAMYSSDLMNIEQLCGMQGYFAWLALATRSGESIGFKLLLQASRKRVTKHRLTRGYQLVTSTHAPVPPP